MSASARGFDRLAGCYRFLEYLAFGADLERARFAHLGRLRDRRRILLLGEGDGRCAEQVLRLAPGACVVCVDASAAMIARARRRLSASPGAGRVSFVQADIRELNPGGPSFDAVATLFVLDCFDTATVGAVVARVQPLLDPGALWLYADFAVPAARGLHRARARAWLRLLYGFFRMETGIEARELPESEAVLAAAGWVPSEEAELQGGLIRSAVFRRADSVTGARSASGAP